MDAGGAPTPPPQQYPAPAVVRPQVNDLPALTEANVSPPLTAVGNTLGEYEPSPSDISLLLPQQYAAPLVATAQVCPNRSDSNDAE